VLDHSSPALIYAKDNQGRVTFASQAVLDSIGKSRDEVIGHTELDFLADLGQAEVMRATDARIRQTGASETIEEAITMADGHIVTYLSTKSAVKDERGQVVGLVGVSIDISARKAIEQRLELFSGELAHRGRNLITISQSLARQTLKGKQPLQEELTAYINRLLAVGRGLDLLRRDASEDRRIGDIVRETVESFVLRGPRVLYRA
jgi:PAS domain S-box-containing protein